MILQKPRDFKKPDRARISLARFAEAAAAAAHGERVIVTKHGRPFIEMVSASGGSGMDFKKAAIIRLQLGLDGMKVSLPHNFDDPRFSQRVVGLFPRDARAF